jgi:tetratricopeptide (TPR) repeat protein
MIDWSWDLLSQPERAVLRRLAVHADGCTLAAAEAVCADAGVAEADVLDLLVRLVDRSLVVAGSGPRYRLLESVAAYCADRMREAGETDQVRGRHLHHYLSLAEQAEPHLHGPEQRTWLRRLDVEAANLRSALSEASRRGAATAALRLANALTWYWFLRGRLTEARRALDTALATPGSASGDLRARASAWRAGIAGLHGDHPGWSTGRDDALRHCAEITDPKTRARAQWFLGHAILDHGELADTVRLVEDALATFREIGDQWGVGAALSTRAKVAHVRADLTALERDATAGAAAFRVVGDRWGLLQATQWLGGLAEMTGRYDEATRRQREGLRMAEDLGLWPEASVALSWLGWIAMQVGDFAEARELCQRALRLAAEQSYRSAEVFARLGLAFAARREGKLDLAEQHLGHLLEQGGGGTALHVPMVLSELGFAAEQRGDPAAATALHLRGLAAARTMGGVRDLAGALDGLAGSAALAGTAVPAARLLGAAAAARASSTLPLAPSERVEVDRITAAVRARLDPDTFAAAYRRGAELTLDEAVALVTG